MTDPGRKDDAGKARYDLIDVRALRELAVVLTHGARKYAPENWRKVPDARARYYAATLRHLEAWRAGQETDPDSGLRHLGHALASVHFLLALDFERSDLGSDA